MRLLMIMCVISASFMRGSDANLNGLNSILARYHRAVKPSEIGIAGEERWDLTLVDIQALDRFKGWYPLYKKLVFFELNKHKKCPVQFSSNEATLVFEDPFFNHYYKLACFLDRDERTF